MDRRRIQDRARAAMPGLYKPVRNAVWLARWYGARLAPRRKTADPYSDEFWRVQEAGDWDGFARLVGRILSPASVLDVGCGSGALLQALRRTDPRLRLGGLEHSLTARRRAQAAGLAVRPFDALALDAVGRRALGAELGHWDLVVCLEVAEHLPPWHGARLVSFLAQWDVVLFSAARLGQGGVWHLNEQPPEYWLRRFARTGLEPHAAGRRLRDGLAKIALAPWYAANALVLTRGGATPPWFPAA